MSPSRASKEGLPRTGTISSSPEHGKTSLERLRVYIDPTDALPVAEQIAREIAHFVATGALRPEERLPPVENAARHFGVGSQTMGTVYQILANSGISINTTGIGTYFTAEAERAARRHLVSCSAHVVVRQARALGLGDDEIVAVILTVLSRVGVEKKTSSK